MDGKTLARIGAVAFVALAITMTVIDMTSPKPAPADTGVPSIAAPAADPLRDELSRCQLLGEAGAHDAACLQAWAENRRRFLAPVSTPLAAPATPEAR
jgi:conjugative transfer region protein TrbK